MLQCLVEVCIRHFVLYYSCFVEMRNQSFNLSQALMSTTFGRACLTPPIDLINHKHSTMLNELVGRLSL